MSLQMKTAKCAKALVIQWGKAKSKQVLPSHFQLTSRGMEAFDTWKYLHTTKVMKYKNLVTVTQKVSKLCEKKHFGSKFLVYKKMGPESTSYWTDI